ncbi:hypothetical protein acdb102_18990 [Acidothermaceae bacterium B102]|nr:hypothetical protein acdb102_18990 [Acidothermaceae bacterium B102]
MALRWVAVIVLCAGCATAQQVSAADAAVPTKGATIPAPSGLPPAVSGGRQSTSADELAGNQADVEPPGPSMIPRISAAQAYAACGTTAEARCDRSVGPTLTLVILSTDIGGRVASYGAPVKRVLDHSPAWILSWSLTGCFPVSGGPAVASASSAASQPAAHPSGYRCTRTAIVDATSGKYLWTEDSYQP